MSHWSDRQTILDCLVNGGTICRWSSVKRSNAVGMATVLQVEHAIFRRSDIRKSKSETKPFGKELEMAMPQETPDGHGAFVGGTSEEGLPVNGLHKAVGRHKTSGASEKASCREWAILEKQPVSHLTGHLGPEDHLKRTDCWCMEVPTGKIVYKVVTTVIRGEVCLNPGPSQCMVIVLYVLLWS